MTQNGLIPVCQKMKGIFKQDLLDTAGSSMTHIPEY